MERKVRQYLTSRGMIRVEIPINKKTAFHFHALYLGAGKGAPRNEDS
jgi:hypothetical protein